MLFFVTPKFCVCIVFSFSWGNFNSQEKLTTMLMHNFGVSNKEHYGMLWYFLGWSIGHFTVMDGSEVDGDLVSIQTFMLYYVNQVVLMLTSSVQEQFP